MKHELVKNWMTADPITVLPTTTLPEAHRIMKENQIRRMPVVDQSGRLVGIVTLGDIRGAEASPATSLSIWELNYLLNRLKVREFMSHDPVFVSPDATIGEAARLMLDHKISGLPVVANDGRLIGIITESDIFSLVVLHEWQTEGTPTVAA